MEKIQDPVFVDQLGYKHALVPDHRAKLKPLWKNYFCRNLQRKIDEHALLLQLRDTASRVKLGMKMLEIHGWDAGGKSILCFGCGEGEEIPLLAGFGADRVAGTDSWQWLDSEDGFPSPIKYTDTNTVQHRTIVNILKDSGQIASYERAAISYDNDDMGSSKFGDCTFDLVCSWRAIEHLERPADVFAEIHRVLKPGGYSYHEYNPFFAIDGGHSAVTLDIPWGHVRLSPVDIERHLDKFRPEEKDKALDFYHRQLNRLSINDVKNLALEAGFEIVALLPRSRTEDIMKITPVIYEQAKRNYPYIELNDLVCRVVRVVLRKANN